MVPVVPMALMKWVTVPPVSRQISRPLHALTARHQDDLGTEGLHHAAAFHAHMLGHDQDHAIALDSRGHGQRDPGIATGRLNQGIARRDLTTPLGMGNHAERGPVLD